jgi:hypothetical protein
MRRMVRCIAFSGLLLSLPVFAQEAEELDTGAAVAPEGTQKVHLAVYGDSSEQFNADVDKGGAFSLWRARIGGVVGVRLNDSMRWDTQARYEFDDYSFSKNLDPWQNLNSLQIATLLKWQQSEKLAVYGGPLVRFATESDTDLGRGFTAGGLVGVNYALQTNLTLGAGVAYVGQIENSSRVLPLLTAKWAFADNWRLTVGFLDVATAGYGCEVAWDVAPKWQLAAGGQYHQARFRLDKSNSTSEGVAQESSGTWYVRATCKAAEHVWLSAYAGVVTGGSLRLETQTGRKIFDNNYDTTGIAGGTVTVRF